MPDPVCHTLSGKCSSNFPDITSLLAFIIAFEINANYSNSDNLDGSYPDLKQKASSDYFGSTLSKDWYVFSGITLTYLFGNKKCYCPN